jgi:hypothetical protein
MGFRAEMPCLNENGPTWLKKAYFRAKPLSAGGTEAALGREMGLIARCSGTESSHDSSLEGRVTSEPVSEMGFFAPGITARFQDGYGMIPERKGVISVLG